MRVSEIILKALDMTSNGRISELAPIISYPQQALSNVYNGYRKMPIKPLQRLCHMTGILDGNKIIDIYDQQVVIKHSAKVQQNIGNDLAK